MNSEPHRTSKPRGADWFQALTVPHAVAVIGASRVPGKIGHSVVQNVLNCGYEGEVVLVNPAANEIRDCPCHTTLAEAQREIDLAIIAVPARDVLQAARDAIHARARALIVVSAGFKEAGPEGAAMERELLEVCQQRGVRLLGPNCLGLINTTNCLNASFANHMPEPGGISIISQSGSLCTAMLDWAKGRGMGLAKVFTIGNEADITESDLLAALADDPQTKVIVAYLESISLGRNFIKTAEEVSDRKPVVVMKSGTTEAGSRAARAHTGSLAGADIAYGAAFSKAGVIRADTFEALFDYAMALAMQPLPQGDNVAVVTNAGGPGIMTADAIEHAGLQVPELTASTMEALRAHLPVVATIENPVDIRGTADPERFAVALDIVQADESVDAAIVILTPQALTQPEATARRILEKMSSYTKPVLAAFMGGHDVIPARNAFVSSKLPDYPSPERAVAALRAMRDHAEWLARPQRVVTRFPVNRRRVERILRRYAHLKSLDIGEVDAKAILRAYDFLTPEGRVTRTADEAAAAAMHVGFPSVMKVVSPQILHKSDVGGVRTNCVSEEEVRDTFELMLLRVQRRMPDAQIEGIYVEREVPVGREVILGMNRDPQFGPMLTFGLGGVFVEVMKDVSFHLAPITEDEAMEMLMGTRSFQLLQVARGQSGVDLKAIAGGLQRISQLVTDFPQIQELSINPLIVREPGKPPMVADASIALSTFEVHDATN